MPGMDTFLVRLLKQQCFSEVNSLYSDKALSYSTVKTGIRAQSDHSSLQAAFSEGRPK